MASPSWGLQACSWQQSVAMWVTLLSAHEDHGIPDARGKADIICLGRTHRRHFWPALTRVLSQWPPILLFNEKLLVQPPDYWLSLLWVVWSVLTIFGNKRYVVRMHASLILLSPSSFSTREEQEMGQEGLGLCPCPGKPSAMSEKPPPTPLQDLKKCHE